MVEDLNPLIQEIKQNSQVLLFAMLKMDDLTDRWTVVVSANNVDDIEKRKELFEKIVGYLKDNPETVGKHNIARIGIFSTDNHLVQDVAKHPEGGKIENEKANGNFIHEGFVLINRAE